jgi:hypothetical protein
MWMSVEAAVSLGIKQRAARLAGSLLFVLAAFVATASVLTLLGHVETRPKSYWNRGAYPCSYGHA